MANATKDTILRVTITPEQAAIIDAAVKDDNFKTRTQWALHLMLSHARRKENTNGATATSP